MPKDTIVSQAFKQVFEGQWKRGMPFSTYFQLGQIKNNVVICLLISSQLNDTVGQASWHVVLDINYIDVCFS